LIDMFFLQVFEAEYF